eukprot:6180038-Pleurochrysis_carterae.AAC.2
MGTHKQFRMLAMHEAVDFRTGQVARTHVNAPESVCARHYRHVPVGVCAYAFFLFCLDERVRLINRKRSGGGKGTCKGSGKGKGGERGESEEREEREERERASERLSERAIERERERGRER